MTLVQLRYVLAVAGFQSFSEAAASLCITQPALSNSIKDLEKELNISIFRRTSHGIELTSQGSEFLGYAQKVVMQADLLKDHYSGDRKSTVRFVVSSQHYSFAVSSFIRLVKIYGMDNYNFCLRETRTMDIIADVHSLAADIGIIYLSDFNRRYLTRIFREQDIVFTPLASFSPHVFLSRSNPLAAKNVITMADLAAYPFICFEQGNFGNEFLAEELAVDRAGNKVIRVSDRATLFNLLLGLNGYTIASGVIEKELNPEIASVPLDAVEKMEIGVIRHNSVEPGGIFNQYVNFLKEALI